MTNYLTIFNSYNKLTVKTVMTAMRRRTLVPFTSAFNSYVSFLVKTILLQPRFAFPFVQNMRIKVFRTHSYISTHKFTHKSNQEDIILDN